MNKYKYFPVCIGLLVVISAFSFYWTSSAQKSTRVQWEYSVINVAYISYTSENQPIITGSVNVCFIQTDGCRNEEIKSELIYPRFLQDFQLENTQVSREIAQSRAIESAFSKAVTKLSSEGWEIMDAPAFEFDAYIPNRQETFNILRKNKTLNVYFKRLKQ
jgi:hypothetical protein